MTGILHLTEAVVTEEVLRGRHTGQSEVLVAAGAVVTPTGWDYLRNHRLSLRRAEAQSPPPETATAAASGGAAAPIPEVLPPGSEAGLLARGRYEHLDRSFGCRTEEFGSGFVEPAACAECALSRRPGECGACNRAVAADRDELEALVQHLTDQIMARLAGG